MVIIEPPSGADWFKANWVYRQLAADTIALFPGEGWIVPILELGAAYGLLNLGELDRKSAISLMRMIKSAIEEILADGLTGERSKTLSDISGYAASLSELQELIDLELKGVGGASQPIF